MVDLVEQVHLAVVPLHSLFPLVVLELLPLLETAITVETRLESCTVAPAKLTTVHSLMTVVIVQALHALLDTTVFRIGTEVLSRLLVSDLANVLDPSRVEVRIRQQRVGVRGSS